MFAPDTAGSSAPLTLTVNPRLDAGLRRGWEGWAAALRAAGAAAGGAWLAQRAGDPELRREGAALVQALLEADEAEGRAEAWIGLAELADGLEDALVADTAWEGALGAGREAANPDVVFAATSALAGIAEAHGEAVAAAEYFIDFLNWRRQPGYVSDAEDVETAFDEVVRLATVDGARREAALFEFRQAGFTRLLEADDDRAVEGDWEADASPYAAWG